MQHTTVRPKGESVGGRFPARPLLVVSAGFYLALAVSNLALLVVPAAAQGIEVPLGPAAGLMWNPAELMPGPAWIGMAAVSVALQVFAVLRPVPARFVALAASVVVAGAMGDLGRWTGPYAGLAAALACLVGAGPALAAVLVEKGGTQ